MINDHFNNFLTELKPFPGPSKYGQSISKVAVESFNLDEVKIENSKLLAMVNQRYREKPLPSVTTAMNEPDFLDFAFLEKGIFCGSSVCRLIRILSNDDDVLDLFSLLEDASLNRKSIGKKPFTRAELSDIFSIKEEDKELFFEDLSEDNSYLAFSNTDKVKQFIPIIPAGTSFLVGDNYLLTNQHVLGETLDAVGLVAEFNYKKLIDGTEDNSIKYEIEKVVASDRELDYALLKLKNNNEQETEIKLNYISMLRDENIIAPPLSFDTSEKIDPGYSLGKFEKEVIARLERAKSFARYKPEIAGIDGEPVVIIQHPRGKYKQIVVSSNRVIAISDQFMYYEADAEHGSSGSPVFNQQWQLVGLHRAYISEGETVVGYEGIRTCQIVKNLEEKAKNPLEENQMEIQEFIDKFVDRQLPWDRTN